MMMVVVVVVMMTMMIVESLARRPWSHKRAEFGVTSETLPGRMPDILSEIMPIEFQRGDVEQECNIWVCLKIRYIPNFSHLIGIMIINHWV